MLDVNAGIPLVDEAALLAQAIELVQSPGGHKYKLICPAGNAIFTLLYSQFVGVLGDFSQHRLPSVHVNENTNV